MCLGGRKKSRKREEGYVTKGREGMDWSSSDLRNKEENRGLGGFLVKGQKKALSSESF